MVELALFIMFAFGYSLAREANKRPIEISNDSGTVILYGWALVGLVSWCGLFAIDNGFVGYAWL